MAINGEIRQLYADREKTKPIYPRVSSNAVFLGNGNSLEALEASVENHSSNIQSAQSDIDNLKYVPVWLTASGWSGSAPYTQTVSVAGMTADWAPGGALCKPVVNGDGSLNVAESMAVLEQMSYVKFLETGNGTVKAYCPYVKPTRNIQLRLPGTVEKG